MSFDANAPQFVKSLRDKLLAADSWTGDIHFPDAVNTDAYPRAIIQYESPPTLQNIFPGVRGVPSGTAEYVIELDAGEYTIAQAETLAQDLCREITQSLTGLIIRSAQPTQAGEPSNGEEAAAEDPTQIAAARRVLITVEYGAE
jgi:hypothetical protein